VPIIINGGIEAAPRPDQHLSFVDASCWGVQPIRAVRLLAADPDLFGEAPPHACHEDVFEAVMPYIERELAQGTRLHSITRISLAPFSRSAGRAGVPPHLAENGVKPGAGVERLARSDCAGRGPLVASMAA